jgi:N-acyl-phosphatidylethanolamine-hydrolysing phospholipase D
MFAPTPSQVISFLFRRYKKGNPLPKVPSHFVYPNPEKEIDPHQPTAMWINHSTYLIELGQKFFLTDPIWSKRCSPVQFMGPKRFSPPPFPIEQLPPIFAILLSHNHYDHLDLPSIRKLHSNHPHCQWVIPFGLKKWFLRNLPGIRKDHLHEMHWGEECVLDDVTVVSTPAQHFSGRHIFDRNHSIWMGCYIKMNSLGKSFYFVGDTGYNSIIFKEIGKLYGPIDLSLIPIGAYLPRDFMEHVHVNPEEAVKIHMDVRSKLSIGGHFGTFNLSYEPPIQPPFDLYHAIEKEHLSWESFRVLRPGQKINW